MRITENQRFALDVIQRVRPDQVSDLVHGNTLKSLHRHKLIYRDLIGWRLGIRGELILAGWTLKGLEAMKGLGEINLERA